MIEEAIRNGTWVPPVVMGRKAELGAKPVMYEAVVDHYDGEKAFDAMKVS